MHAKNQRGIHREPAYLKAWLSPAQNDTRTLQNLCGSCGAEHLKVSAGGGELRLYRPGYKKLKYSEIIGSIQELSANI